jgi:glycosyltransferase involved in cell wall biosynthesis
MTRIAYLISQYPAVNHTFILREVRTLRAQGIEIEAISVSGADRALDALSPEEREEAERTYYIKPLSAGGVLAANLRVLFTRPTGYITGLLASIKLAGWSPSRILSYLFYFAEAVVAGDRMRQLGVNHVHTHFSSTVALILVRVFPYTMSVTFHGPVEFMEPTAFHLAEKVERSRFVVAISNYARSQLMVVTQPDQWNKIDVSPLGIDPSVFSPKPANAQPDIFELLCVGRLAPVKAQHILVQAVKRLVQRGKRVRLTLVGDGEDRASLEAVVREEKLGEHVVFAGWQLQAQVRALYMKTDIFVLASFEEGVPVVLMEAMACEVPCVATGITGIPELIEHGVSGLLVPPSDAEALAAAVEKIMGDSALRARLASAGREAVVARYDLSRNTARLRDIFARRLAAS